MLRLVSPPGCGRCATRIRIVRPQSPSPPSCRTGRKVDGRHYTTNAIDRRASRASAAFLPTPTRRTPGPSPLRSPIPAPPRRLQSGFQPARPPSPESLGKPSQAKDYRRTRKWLRRVVRLSIALAILYAIDTRVYDASLTRSLRTFATGLLIAVDYKLNFRPDPWIGDSVADVHSRSAQRVFDLLRENGGLYLKIGQAIAMQSAILPPEFQKMFARMFDDAPQNDWREVEKVIREDFGGKSVEDVFGVSFSGDQTKGIMERTARASASVAQVHWARLQDGREVAIKVQKREIARQVGWDLWAFRVVTRVYTWWFDLPLYHLVPYISERLMLETDFQNEAINSAKMKELIASEPRLRGRVYIPQVYHDLSSKRIMTAEWIEGVRLWDKESLTNSWHGGWRKGSPGAGGRPLDPPPPSVTANIPTNHPNSEKLKPTRSAWRGPGQNGGLGLSLRPVMQTMTDLFSAQMFLWGIVHCDPHPGNIFIRRLPSGQPELVLIDHGLYITMTPKFRREYALFWRSLMTFDNATIARITKDEWGISAPDIFASATLMKPYEGGDGKTLSEIKSMSRKEQRVRQFEMQQKMRKGIRDILSQQEKFPQELIFIGRNLRIVQGNNQFLGSPINRIKITGTWASRALAEEAAHSVWERWREYGRHVLFRVVLVSTDFYFWWSKVKQVLGRGGGMDDDLEENMRRMASGMGVELQHGVFDG